MKTNILTLCDFAKDYQGQLSIVGTFNRINTTNFPTSPISFCLVCQFEIKDNIAGDHYVTISIKNKETGVFLIQTQELKLNIQEHSEGALNNRFYTNLILNFDKMVFQEAGAFSVEVICDGSTNDTEFYVSKV